MSLFGACQQQRRADNAHESDRWTENLSGATNVQASDGSFETIIDTTWNQPGAGPGDITHWVVFVGGVWIGSYLPVGTGYWRAESIDPGTDLTVTIRSVNTAQQRRGPDVSDMGSTAATGGAPTLDPPTSMRLQTYSSVNSVADVHIAGVLGGTKRFQIFRDGVSVTNTLNGGYLRLTGLTGGVPITVRGRIVDGAAFSLSLHATGTPGVEDEGHPADTTPS